MIDMRDKSRYPDKIEWTVPNDLIRDMDLAASGVSGFGKHH